MLEKQGLLYPDVQALARWFSMGWSPFRSRGELVNNIQGAMHDSVTDYGLPQTLDALAFVRDDGWMGF